MKVGPCEVWLPSSFTTSVIEECGKPSIAKTLVLFGGATVLTIYRCEDHALGEEWDQDGN